MALTKQQLNQLRRRRTGQNRVAVAIEMSGETSTAIADALGLTLPYVSDVARNRYNTITVENARKFADYFGCTIEDLFPAREAVAS